ncbi:MAG: proline dehydrogenase family protein [Crocinitomicaceae bacterium]|nr:proline dehydrogenase family protein [Crocinitomicaceae bacterium]MDG2464504.1 proline dehydrogenase family protein [Crocinitomicaceae bacterium]
MIKRTIFRQFCGGENIEECAGRIKELKDSGIGAILDYSIEGKTAEVDFNATVDEIMDTLIAGEGNKAIPFAVFKVTGISRFGLLEKINDANAELLESEKAELARLMERIEKLAKKSFDTKTPLFFDAEETWIQDGIDRITYALMEKYNKEKAIIYNTLQIYRHDRLEHLKKQTAIAQAAGYKLGIKLVRGAYMEKERDRAEDKKYPSPIQPNKIATDKDFDDALRFMVDYIDSISFCAGSHNEESNALLTQLMQEKGITHDDPRAYFAQLLGMSDHITYNLAHANYNVAKYVPYGPISEVMPYLLRRADENTSVAGQTSRELSLILQETKRRKTEKK